MARPTTSAAPGHSTATSYEGLVKAFGAANVSYEPVFGGGDIAPMTVVFPKDFSRETWPGFDGWADQLGKFDKVA